MQNGKTKTRHALPRRRVTGKKDITDG